jgi:hypothetical protein
MSVEYLPENGSLVPRSRYSKLDRLPNCGGTEPVKGMPERLRYLKFFILPKNTGIRLEGFTKLFMLRSKCSNCFRDSKEGLISPDKAY